MRFLAAQLAKPGLGDMAEVIAPLMGVFFVAFFIALVTTPLMRMLAIRNGIVDWPDFKRKSHVEPIAYLGGLAVFLAWVGGVAMCFFMEPSFIDSAMGMVDSIRFPITVILGAAVITLTGLFDDVYGISPRVKIGGQLLTAAMLVYESDLGLKLVDQMFASVGVVLPPELGWIPYTLGAVLVTLFVIGGCNSLNLLDGLDGLAAGVSAIAGIGFLFIAGYLAAEGLNPDAGLSLMQLEMNPVRIVMCLALIGAVLGFLPYNFNPANIFMGDAGSLLLGYLCVATILMFAETTHSGPLVVMSALIVFALPIADTTLAIVRRKLRGAPIFSPDNQHMHHQLTRVGLSTKRAVLVLYAMAGIFAITGGLMVFLRTRYVIAVFLVIFGFILVTAFKAGHRLALVEKLKAAQEAEARKEEARLAALAADTADAPPGNGNGNGNGHHGHANGNGHHAADAGRPGKTP